MSSLLVGAVFNSGPAEMTAAFVLLAIAENADDFGFAFPSTETIASKARCDVRTVYRILDVLEAEGWMKRGRKVIKGKANAYFIDIARLGVTVSPEARISPVHAALLRRHGDNLSRIFRACDEATDVSTEDAPETVQKPVEGVFVGEKSGDIPQPSQVTKPQSQVTKQGGSGDTSVTLTFNRQLEPERENAREREASPADHPGADASPVEKRERGPLDLVALAGLIVLAHPRARLRGWTERDVLYADRIATIAAVRAQAELDGTTPEEAAVSILAKIERIAREVPRDQWRFLKEIDRFMRLRDYRMQPEDLYSPQGGSYARTTSNQPAGTQRSPATQRGVESRANIAAARERRLRRHAVAVDGGDTGPIPAAGASGGDAGHVPGGVGADGKPLRAA